VRARRGSAGAEQEERQQAKLDAVLAKHGLGGAGAASWGGESHPTEGGAAEPGAAEAEVAAAGAATEGDTDDTDDESAEEEAEEPDEWFYVDHNGESAGPITTERVRAMTVEGVLQPESFVWASHLPGWSSVEDAGLSPNARLKSAPTEEPATALAASIAAGCASMASASATCSGAAPTSGMAAAAAAAAAAPRTQMLGGPPSRIAMPEPTTVATAPRGTLAQPVGGDVLAPPRGTGGVAAPQEASVPADESVLQQSFAERTMKDVVRSQHVSRLAQLDTSPALGLPPPPPPEPPTEPPPPARGSLTGRIGRSVGFPGRRAAAEAPAAAAHAHASAGGVSSAVGATRGGATKGGRRLHSRAAKARGEGGGDTGDGGVSSAESLPSPYPGWSPESSGSLLAGESQHLRQSRSQAADQLLRRRSQQGAADAQRESRLSCSGGLAPARPSVLTRESADAEWLASPFAKLDQASQPGHAGSKSVLTSLGSSMSASI